MKFNWGTGIAFVYGLFALTMIAVVIHSRSYDPGLVEKDYYQLDLNYQEHYNKKQHAAQLKTPLEVRFDAAQQVIRLQFPSELGTATGKVKCFRSSTVRDDQKLEIKPDPSGKMEIPVGQMAPGLWNLEVDWQAGAVSYFNTAVVTVIRA